MNVKWKILGTGLLITAVMPLIAEKPFKELQTPKPADWRTSSANDFRIDHARLAGRDRGLIYGNRESLLKLARFYEENPGGQALWKSMQLWAARSMNDWYFRNGHNNRYMNQCWALDTLGFIYALTGHKLLGRFLHDHIMQITRLPEEFWLQNKSQRYKPKRPHGMLAPGMLSRSLVGCLSGTEDLFTPEELTEIKDALRRKALISMLNFLEDAPSVNHNFMAIAATGVYITGKYLNDTQACSAGKSALQRYIDNSVEDDGSYGEGTGYFEYPVNNLAYAVAAMSREERKNFFEKSGLRRSPEWLAYPYLYSSKKEDKTLRCVYGDNSYMARPGMQVFAMIADVCGNPLANWLGEYFGAGSLWRCSSWQWALVHFMDSREDRTADPSAISGLPLIRGFANGENFIRSSWEPDSTVLSLYTAGPTRVKYAHQRPERNSINLGAFGEYFIVSPHSSSYRSPIYYNYDRSTLSANTIRIDNGDQLFPMRRPWFGKTFPSYANYGKPIGKLIRLESNPDFDVMTGDARLCYKEKPAAAFRTVLYRRPHNYFVVIDRMADRLPHTYTALWHFNNRDGKLKLSDAAKPSLLAERPRADLAVFTAADCSLTRSMTDGYMHGPQRDLSPGGRYEGKPGSAKVLNVSNAEPLEAVTFVTVLQPLRKNAQARPVNLKDGKLTIGSDLWELDGGSIRFGNRSVPLETVK